MKLWISAGHSLSDPGASYKAINESTLNRGIRDFLIPLLDGTFFSLSPSPRFYEGTFLIGTIFLAAVLLQIYMPAWSLVRIARPFCSLAGRKIGRQMPGLSGV